MAASLWAIVNSDDELPKLTESQSRAYKKFAEYIATFQASPTLDEFGQYLGISKQGAYHHLLSLARKGYLKPLKSKRARRLERERLSLKHGDRLSMPRDGDKGKDSKIISVHLDVYERLRDLAVPFEESPNMVIRKVLRQLDRLKAEAANSQKGEETESH